MYGDEDPRRGSVGPGSLPNVEESWRPYRSLILTQKTEDHLSHTNRMRILELRNGNVKLPYGDDTTIWCKMFKMNHLDKKHQLVRVKKSYTENSYILFLIYFIK